MGHCSLGKKVCLSWAVADENCNLGKSVHLTSVVVWDTVAWIRISPKARLLGGTLWPGLECPLSWTVGWDTLSWVRVPTLAGLLGGTFRILGGQDKLVHRHLYQWVYSFCLSVCPFI